MRRRTPGQGRLLMVFDSASHPLRHVSYERTMDAAAAGTALAELAEARHSAEERFGAPARCTVSQPTQLVWLTPIECEWRFSDLQVRTTAIQYGARGIVLGEITEVPWPVRATAPADGTARLQSGPSVEAVPSSATALRFPR